MLNRVAQGAVRELAGRGINDLTAGEIVRLHILGDRQERAGKSAHCVIRSIPCAVGNAVLRPLTCAGMEWFETAIQWIKEGDRLRFWILPFAMAHSTSSYTFAELDTAKKACKALRKWKRTLTATPAEIDEACGIVHDIGEDCERAEAQSAFLSAVDYIAQRHPGTAFQLAELADGAFETPTQKTRPDEEEIELARDREYGRWAKQCAELAAIAGGNPRDWYQQDTRLVTHAYTVAIEAAALRGGATGNDDNTPQELIDAIKAFRAAVAEIVAAREERGADDGQ